MALAICANRGVPIALHKTEGPIQVITFLGIELDAMAEEVQLLRRVISLSAIPKELHHRVRLNAGFRSDLAWWKAFLGS